MLRQICRIDAEKYSRPFPDKAGVPAHINLVQCANKSPVCSAGELIRLSRCHAVGVRSLTLLSQASSEASSGTLVSIALLNIPSSVVMAANRYFGPIRSRPAGAVASSWGLMFENWGLIFEQSLSAWDSISWSGYCLACLAGFATRLIDAVF